jgi:signal peptidase
MAPRREIAFWGGLASLFLLTTAGVMLAWAVVPAWIPGWSSSVVVSGSMAPRIEAGDVVVWSRTEAADIGPGSVAIFLDERGERVAHRVVDHRADGSLTTRGDANATPDSTPVPPDRVQGAGRVLVPLVGVPRLWWAEGRWWAIASLVGVVGGALLLSRLTWAPEFDPWLPHAAGPGASGADITMLPIWLPPAADRRRPAPPPPAARLLSPAARRALIPRARGDHDG